jgi:hypothetical protein
VDDERAYGVLVYRLIPPDYPPGFGAIMDYGCEYVADDLPKLGDVITVRVLSDGEPHYEIRASVTWVSNSDEEYPIAAEEIASDGQEHD